MLPPEVNNTTAKYPAEKRNPSESHDIDFRLGIRNVFKTLRN